MKKLIALILSALMLLGCCAFAEEAAAPVNLLPNPDFETGDLSGQWTTCYAYHLFGNDIPYVELVPGHDSEYAVLVKSANAVGGQPESDMWLSAIALDVTEIIKAAGNGEYFFKAYVKLADESKFATCDAWLQIYDQNRENKYTSIQNWKLESNTPVDGMGWTQIGLDAEGNDKSFQVWWNNGLDCNGKAPTQQAGAREILVDDFEFTHAILWVTCGIADGQAIPYILDDAEFYVVPSAK